MYRLFEQLPEEKKTRILQAAIEEFAEHGFDSSSTNRIVKRVGIAKGSLFKYFATKKDLYLYVVDYVIKQIVIDVRSNLPELPPDPFERIKRYAGLELEIYERSPQAHKLLKRAFTNDGSDVYHTLLVRYGPQAGEFLSSLLAGSDQSCLRWDLSTTIRIVKWVLEGLNVDFLRQAEQTGGMADAKEHYMQQLDHYLTALKEGLYVHRDF